MTSPLNIVALTPSLLGDISDQTNNTPSGSTVKPKLKTTDMEDETNGDFNIVR